MAQHPETGVVAGRGVFGPWGMCPARASARNRGDADGRATPAAVRDRRYQTADRATSYNGIPMRSRLEARTAAAFDRLRITGIMSQARSPAQKGSSCRTSDSPSGGNGPTSRSGRPLTSSSRPSGQGRADIRTTEPGAWLYLVTEWDLDDLLTLFRVATDANVERYCAAAGGCVSP